MSPLVAGLALWALFTIDAGFWGWRAAAGRDGRIRKRGYFARSFAGGMLAGQIAFALPALLGLALAARDPSLKEDLGACGAALLLVFAPFTALVFLVFLVRAIPSVELRSITSVVFFAPADIARPVVILGGLAYGVSVRPRVETALVALATAGVAFALGPILERRATRRSRSFIQG